MKLTWSTKFTIETELTVGSYSLHGQVTPRDNGGFDWWIYTISGPPKGVHTDGVSETIIEAIAAAEAGLRQYATEIDAEQEGTA